MEDEESVGIRMAREAAESQGHAFYGDYRRTEAPKTVQAGTAEDIRVEKVYTADEMSQETLGKSVSYFLSHLDFYYAELGESLANNTLHDITRASSIIRVVNKILEADEIELHSDSEVKLHDMKDQYMRHLAAPNAKTNQSNSARDAHWLRSQIRS